MDHDDVPEARVRRHRWFAWVWAVPILAAAIVIWLAVRSLVTRGPEITIAFHEVEGLQARQSTIQHRGVTVGTVERLELVPDMSRVIVHARVTRAAAPWLNENTKFYIVSPRVSIEGISGLSTLVSGSYIEMSPAPGTKAQREFVGLDAAPGVEPSTPGREFTMTTSDLGSLTRGSPITYRGVSVGEVQDYAIAPDGQTIKVTVFIRAPYDRLVHPETRFWNAGGVDVSLGARGVRIRASSWQQLLSGGIAFETPASALNTPVSAAGATFPLYENQRAAMRVPRTGRVVYVADFEGNLRGVDAGTPVELEGVEIGQVRDSQLRFDPKAHTLTTLVTLEIDPDRIRIQNMTRPANADPDKVAQEWIETLVAHGLRAQATTANLITGLKIVALDMVKGAPPARIEHVDEYLKLPTTSSQDVEQILQSLQAVLNNLESATSGPELRHAIKSLDATLTHLDQLTTDVQPDVKELIRSLRATSDAAQSALQSVHGLVGQTGPPGPDLTELMQQLTDAARAVRALADYLDRHPEALLRGRRGE
ncbi:MAG TPA: MlaD family protein [Steroidobacteraceae bacterium]|nr:MlaD family protein [Steroidobacteraceae bacterium]